ncbi:MAG: bifunctional glutamate N-acetyltransferase/amino-acid acetyltransferase ArgJ [bacterium]|nr:bifunctional glutamate N-acetyltransferase/amino-acid acetyltransferase ArgJ [bacterium]
MSVTAAAGFAAAGLATGIKQAGALDLALVVGGPDTIGAGVFTVNQAAAAPVIVSREHLAHGPTVHAVVLNSGCANAGTGDAGLADARASAAVAAAALGCSSDEVLVCSTGGIGPPLPVDKLLTGIADGVGALGTNGAAGTAAARAIMTTDTVPKESLRKVDGYTVGGMAKGAGMVRPDMATMLVVLTTDAAVSPELLDAALHTAVDGSFHALNVDGCPSTNDTVLLLASGRSGVVPEPAAFTAAVAAVCWDLANQLAADAEGASRVVTIEVIGAADDATARKAGRLVADSALVRSAFYGGDPNWGRLLGALGATDVEFDPAQFGIAYSAIAIAKEGVAVDHDNRALHNAIAIAKEGVAVDHDNRALHNAIATGDFTVTMTVGAGPGTARVITTDLTPEYVSFNAEYS